MSEPIASSSTSTSPASAPVTVGLAASKNGRTPGKAHKSEKTAVKRSYISNSIKTPFEKRREKDRQTEATKALEKEMKDDKEEERQRKVTIIKERRERTAERHRMEEMKAKMSAKKLQRMKKRQGRSKKING
ncbi:rRNA-processing protein CGR1 [Kwoniella heveanensis CBS 569]|uniref:rRNA-processing protein n=1 Tax=Kwoniella heveanensis BCC8398 TaxID=1296120 RepID=A0A1B9H1I7_9TREE|nr:rRNA-processing protein CGR1 [Kwoniella heveanensis BCC8398]OCF46076.1 rRNA-processing protein CGR1 [Kwoniella heveanensis CBS 569]